MDAYRQMTQDDNDAPHQANVRTALRTVVVHGLEQRFSLPDSEELTWKGVLQWSHSNGDKPHPGKFDWLVDYLADKVDDNHESEGDALLALSATHGLWSSPKQRLSMCSSVVWTKIATTTNINPPESGRRYAALRLVSDTRKELAAITDDSMPQDVNTNLLDSLCRTLFAAVCPNHQTKSPTPLSTRNETAATSASSFAWQRTGGCVNV